MRGISILLVEDSVLFRSALINLFAKYNLISVVACSSSSLASSLQRARRDVVVIDTVSWTAGLTLLVKAVKSTSMTTPVILLGREDLVESQVEVFAAGPVGFVEQTASAQVLVQAVRAVANKHVWFDARLFRRIIRSDSSVNKWGKRQEPHFNQKELQVLAFIACGKTNKEIGIKLGRTERTIKAYVSQLFQKTGFSGRSGLAGFAVTHRVAKL